MNKEYPFIEYHVPLQSDEELIANSNSFFHQMNQRRSVRDISDKPVPKEVIENMIKTASTAPSGAHVQPWTFVVVSNTDTKKQIRIAAEEEEKKSYDGRMSEQWIKDLAPLGTNEHKPFLESAPYLIIVFKQAYRVGENNTKIHNYYVNESVGLAAGFLLAAIHQAGLVSLTHTPSPMNFLTKLLNRPTNEKPFLLIPVGWPDENAKVPDIVRKNLAEISIWHE
jgi:iodotyrosine deiodinase